MIRAGLNEMEAEAAEQDARDEAAKEERKQLETVEVK